jgi:Lrp/AsnC family leucine-responsive transcriptional regulator
MEKQGIIDGYEVRLNPERFNRSQVSFMQIQVLPGGDCQQVAQQLSEHPEIQEVHYIAGDDSFLVKIRTADTEALSTLLHEKIKPIAGVGSTRTLPVLATHKETAQIPIE